MPQPLSKLRPACKAFQFDADRLSDNPALSSLVATAIARWASIEYRMGWLLVQMLGAQAAPAFAMFSALTSTTAQTDVLRAAAQSVLKTDDLEAFNIVLKVVSTHASERHRLAHGLWGHTPDLPDALLRTDSRAVLDWELAWSKYQRDPHGEFAKAGKNEAWLDSIQTMDRSKIFVYRHGDLQRIIRDFNEVSETVFLFGHLINPEAPGTRDEKYHSLSTLRLFGEALSLLRERRKNAQVAQP